MPQFIQVEQRGNIKIVTLNRPDALNAIAYKLAEEFHAVLDDVKYDMETRVCWSSLARATPSAPVPI